MESTFPRMMLKVKMMNSENVFTYPSRMCSMVAICGNVQYSLKIKSITSNLKS
jgi:hypothetical protein